jgi:hypothetical protein
VHVRIRRRRQIGRTHKRERVLKEVKNYDEYCGGQSQSVVVGTNGSLCPIAPEEISHPEKCIGGYDKWARRLMFDFANPQMTDEEFSKPSEVPKSDMLKLFVF